MCVIEKLTLLLTCALWYNKELIVVQIWYLLIFYYKRYVSLWRYYMKGVFLRNLYIYVYIIYLHSLIPDII